MTGMRRSEVLGQRWKDVDLERSRLSVVQTLLAPNDELQFETPKTEKGDARSPLDAGTVAGLRAHAAHQLEEQVVSGASGLVFTTEDGSPVHPHAFTRARTRPPVR